jgi:flavin-dependent dehydrogenase
MRRPGRPAGTRGPLRAAIVGAGPAGAALAILLAERGAAVTLFEDARRPELLVGEPLVPAAIPLLRRLSVEKATAQVGRVKPGVSFVWSKTDRYGFTFARFAPAVFPYAYNVPRPAFDDELVARAVAAGATRIRARARLEPATGGGAELALAPDTLAAAPGLGGFQPNLIVDATGRARCAARVLGIAADVGSRRDVAHFAHYEGFLWPEEPPGQVLIGRGQAGWSWCIPLRERLSVGIVIGGEAAARLGRTPEERLSQAILGDPWLHAIVGGARRVTAVGTYANYQLISGRAWGPGWVAVGDAFGFVDPMLSPGIFLSLRSAELVAEASAPALATGTAPPPAAFEPLFRSYARTHVAALGAWRTLVDRFYDGRMLALMRAGRGWMAAGESRFKQVMQGHIERHIALQASGAATTARYSCVLLELLGRWGLRGVPTAEMAIR